MSKHSPIVITEYGKIISEKNIDEYTSVSSKTFEKLEAFILSANNNGTEAAEVMNISIKKGIGKVITAKNYVGTISLGDGNTIEILPKLYQNGHNQKDIKKLLVKMIKTLIKVPFKTLQQADMDISNMNILEIFIKMFIDEIYFIVKRGLKSTYTIKSDNLNYYKGKINFNKQIKYNYAHNERCYSEYDSFNQNRPENRIIKTTLKYLLNKTNSMRNKKDIKVLLEYFAEVQDSKDYKTDFQKISFDRSTKDYENALVWSRVFLQGKTFTAFSGEQSAFALLFPMEQLFESYIASEIKKIPELKKYKIKVQDNRCRLFDNSKAFLLIPDIVIETDKAIYILDTKWKLLSNKVSSYGISQADMYQMYAYQKRYKAKNVTLIFPKTDSIDSNKAITFKNNDSDEEVTVKFVDLFNIKDDLKNLIGHLDIK